MAGEYHDHIIKLDEAANADADVAGQGQFWVKSDAPNTPMFTDDAGNDGQLSNTITAEVDTSTGETLYDITVPDYIREIILTAEGISTSGTSDVIIQLGDSGGIETSGYVGSVGNGTSTAVNYSSGFDVASSVGAANTYNFQYHIVLKDHINNTWSEMHLTGFTSSGSCNLGQGSKSLSGAITTVRLTTAGGSDTFDAGSISLQYN